MRKTLINMVAFIAVGGILGSVGVFVDMWQFWVLIACLGTVQINSSINVK